MEGFLETIMFFLHSKNMEGGNGNMKIKNMSVLFTVAVLIIISIIAVSPAHAETNSGSSKNPFSLFVELIAQKLGIDKTKVQNIANEYKNTKMKEKKATMQTRQESRLNNLVKKGKITEAQKQAILQKLKEFENTYSLENMKDLSKEEKRKKMEEKQEKLKLFLESINIEPGVILGIRRGKPSLNLTPTQ